MVNIKCPYSVAVVQTRAQLCKVIPADPHRLTADGVNLGEFIKQKFHFVFRKF